MLKELLKILGHDKATATALSGALDTLEANLPGLESVVRDCEQRRTGLLLDPAATDAQHDKADEALRLAIRDRDRAHAARSNCPKRSKRPMRRKRRAHLRQSAMLRSAKPSLLPGP